MSDQSQITVPHSLRIGEVLTVILGFGLATLAIIARVYTKLCITRKLLLEDYFSIAGYLELVAYLGLAIVIGKNGGDIQHKAYLSTVETILYDPTIVLVKASILLQYVTVFVAHRRNFFHYAIHFLIWANIIFYIIITFWYIFQCSPRRKLWIPETPGHCSNEHDRGVFSGSINVASDFLIFLLPFPILLHLQMPLNKKIRLLFVFGFGFFACVASVVRLVYSIKLDAKLDPHDYQLTLDKEGLWAFAEIAIGIIVGCMPLVHKCFKHMKTSISTSSSLGLFESSSGGSSWRRLFGKSSASGGSGSRKFFNSKDSSSLAPHIGTLNMTRASFASVDKVSPGIPLSAEKDLPKALLPVHGNKEIIRVPVRQADVSNQYFPRANEDVERATPFLDIREAVDHERQVQIQRTQSRNQEWEWENHTSISDDRGNETRRAQYDLYP